MFAKCAQNLLCQTHDRAKRFLRADDGTVTIFVAMITMVTMTLGGLALDVVRFETQRAQLQSAIDRAVLSAAATAQTEADVSTHVTQYLTAQRLTDYRVVPNFSNRSGEITLGVDVEQDINTFFLRYFGYPNLVARATAQATQNVRSVEISLILDRSGSMIDNGKLNLMQTAATNFVTEMLENNTHSNVVSISVIPYNDRIILGQDLASVFNLSSEHSLSTCARIPDPDFQETAIRVTDPIDRLMHFDYVNHLMWVNFVRAYCPTTEANQVVPWSNNAQDLNAHIRSLTPEGWASLDQAMKWGAALLDPAAQPAAAALASTEDIVASFANRPLRYADDALKVIVLITDGLNTGESLDILPHYKSGPSPVYRFNQGGVLRWSIYHEELGRYYVSAGAQAFPLTGAWQSAPFGGSAARQLSWQELWAGWTYQTILTSFLYPASQRALTDGLLPRDRAFALHDHFAANALDWGATEAQANANFITMCAAAASRDIVVFTIGVDTTFEANELLRACAGTPANHYQARGVDLTDAFSSISEAIGMLRLVE